MSRCPYLQTTWSLGGITVSAALLLAGVFGAAITAALHGWLNWTGSGKALLATAQSRIGAVSCGIDVGQVRLRAFAIGSALAAVAGVLLILVIPLAAQSADNLTILAFVTIALGGLGSYKGVALAALVVGLAQSVVGYYFGGDAENVLPYVLLIVVMAMRPGRLGRAPASGG